MPPIPSPIGRPRPRCARRVALAAAFGAVLLGAQASPRPAGASPVPLDPACAVPEPLVTFSGRLDHLIGRVRSGAEVRILAIGSSSTQGHGASTPGRAYPARLAVELAERLPTARFTVVNRGIGGEVAAATAKRLLAETATAAPDLVIWQVGTNDAVRGVASAEMTTIVENGIDTLRARGIDVLLMDPQFFPRIAESAAYAGVVARIDELALTEKVPVFRRFDAMRHWAGRPNPPPMLYADAFHMNDLGYACVAEVLAEGLARRVEAAGRSDPAAAIAGGGAASLPATTTSADAEGALTH